MYTQIQLARKYFRYYLHASNGKGHGMHSPFVFDFIRNVLMDKSEYPAYHVVESLRKELINNHELITINDLGAGSSTGKTDQRKISAVAKNAAKPKKYAQLLYRMVQYYKPSAIVELGTSLGISTAYLSLANPSASVVTMEGSHAVAIEARKNFDKLQLGNIRLTEGNFDDTLTPFLNKVETIDFVFLDGNHRFEPTTRYFNAMLNKINNNSIMVLDDIHWSAEMESAWQVIGRHSAVQCSIDLFFFGIVFFRKEFHEKQHFSIRF